MHQGVSYLLKITWTFIVMTHGVVHYFQHTPSDSRFATFYPTSILLPLFQNKCRGFSSNLN
uniref:Uncharacterized protein n=1 Tax=Aegilops tauschii subsp. strangulata TaxID=200361 RepID=A0A453IUR1_AEGTS